jgi:hypothetical protein
MNEMKKSMVLGIVLSAILLFCPGASIAESARFGSGFVNEITTHAINQSAVTITGGSITGITDLAVADGGTGASALTVNGVLYGNNTSAIGATVAGGASQVLIGGTPPSWASTISGFTLTSPIIQKKEVIGKITGPLTPEEVQGSVVSNVGMGATAATLTLPAAAAGYSFLATVGETSAAAWTFTAATAGTLWLDGEGAHNSIALATPVQGNHATCSTAKMSGTGVYTVANLRIGTTNTNVRTDAFNFAIAGTGYTKAAVAAGTALAGDNIPDGKYGAWALDIGADGTVDVVPATGNGAGTYTTSPLAIAGLPDVEAAHVRLGNTTASNAGAVFDPGTTALDAATVTEAYTSTAVYTPVYHWFCTSGTATVWAHE